MSKTLADIVDGMIASGRACLRARWPDGEIAVVPILADVPPAVDPWKQIEQALRDADLALSSIYNGAIYEMVHAREARANIKHALVLLEELRTGAGDNT